MTSLGFIGCGAITGAMVHGLKASALASWPILLSPRNAEMARYLSMTHPLTEVAVSNQDVADRSDILILAVRPQISEVILRDLRLASDQKVISLIAGLDHMTISGWTGAQSVCRAIPLPFVAQGLGSTPVFPADPTALALFDHLGGAIPVTTLSDFNTFATLSALMGSFFGLAEIVTDWAGRQGLCKTDARRYVSQLFGNLGDVLRDDPQELATLRQHHSTAGGLNEQLFGIFQTNGGVLALDAALDSVMARVTKA